MKKKLVLDTELTKVYLDGNGYTVYIRMGDGKWMMNRPHAGDLKGLIGALTLSIDAISGKIWPAGTVDLDQKEPTKQDALTIEYTQKKLGTP